MMKALSPVPLAWLNLTHQKRRLFVSLAGVAFAVVLMFMEMGFWNALLDGVVALIQTFNADLVLVNKEKYALNVNQPFPRERLYQALAVHGVRAANPLYLETRISFWKNTDSADPDQPNIWPIRVVAFDLAHPALRIPEIEAYRSQLQLPDTTLMDVKSKKHFGRCAADIRRELARRSIRVVGTFSLGTDFSVNGNVLMSDRNFAKYFPDPSSSTVLGKVEVGLIRTDPNVDRQIVQQTLQQDLPADVVVFSKEEYAQNEREFWQNATPVGFVFGLGLAMGFVVGVIICYQVLAADISDHLPEFATLKAIGYSNFYLTGVVLWEALLLAVLGFVPGLAISKLFYALLAFNTGLPLRLTAGRGVTVLLLTVAMCICSGMLAVRKVRKADPAEVF
jgi:putative ABC transport system permease protein